MKQKFTLSQSNKIYIAVITLLFVVLFIAVPSKTSFLAGEFIGRLIGLLLLSSIFAWIVWRLSGKKEKAGTVTFNIILTLFVIGLITFPFTQKRFQLFQEESNIKELIEEFNKTIATTNDKGKLDTAYNKFVDSYEETLIRLTGNSTSQEKRLYRAFGDFVTKISLASEKWYQSSDAAIYAPRIFDYSLLNSEQEFDYRKNILRLHIEETKAYKKFYDIAIPNLKKQLTASGDSKKIAKSFIRGATRQYILDIPTIEKLSQAHIEYANKTIQVLDLLQIKRDEWEWENDELIFYNENLLNEYNELYNEIVKNGDIIDTL